MRAAQWFAILADETVDVCNHEQLSISICWVDESYGIHEDFIGLVHVSSTTGEALTSTIKDVLIHCSLPLSQCRGQSYDGAANMMGGVGARIGSEEASAITVHCLAHCLNLCLQDAARKFPIIRDALDVVNEIFKLI